MDQALQELVRQRAGLVCEYCHYPAPPFHIEHIRARQHGGRTISENLALSCIRCNLHKGPNLTGIDPSGGLVTELFNPRIHTWREHFRWHGPRLIGITPVGRTTISVLAINDGIRVKARAKMLADGVIL